jgi:hypothetical protein
MFDNTCFADINIITEQGLCQSGLLIMLITGFQWPVRRRPHLMLVFFTGNRQPATGRQGLE